ncbi:protein of unknown function [Legionella hackeliae]|uniref:Uncharacterized protein n=1 Tax=Legionella hackeliae TaxID=449 RepID=A0A0A8UST5_LEGHA|nr:protein of unknown function [Legionella hackeliae]
MQWIFRSSLHHYTFFVAHWSFSPRPHETLLLHILVILDYIYISVLSVITWVNNTTSTIA